MQDKFYRICNPIMWLLFACLTWEMSYRATTEFLQLGYKVVACALVVIVITDVGSRIYVHYRCKKLAAIARAATSSGE